MIVKMLVGWLALNGLVLAMLLRRGRNRRLSRARWLSEAARSCCAMGYHGFVTAGTSARYDVCSVCGAWVAPLKGRA